MSNYNDYIFKIILIGDLNVGKTSILTLGNNSPNKFCFEKIIKVNEKNITLVIWDTTEQEKFLGPSALFYREASGIFLVYDISNLNSFQNIRYWVD